MPGPAGVLALAIFLILVPWGAYRARSQIAHLAAMPREHYFRNVISQQFLFGCVALATMFGERIDVHLGRVDVRAFAVALALLGITVVVMAPHWKAAVVRREPHLALIAPRTSRQRAWWIAVSLAAGISEEFVWRGVLAGLLVWITGAWWIAAGVTSVAFGVAHSLQGWKNALVITAMALVMQGFVRWADGILLAMLLHAAYDIAAGLSYGRLCDAAGMPVSAAEVTAARAS